MKSKKNQAKPVTKKKPVKSMRGIAEMYDEVKERHCVSLTPTGHQQLTNLAKNRDLSLSEFLERIGRKTILLASEDNP